MRLKVMIFVFVLLAATSVASANTDTLTLNDGGSDVMGGVYVGPYDFTGSGGLSGPFQLDCDDFSDEVYGGEYWNVIVTAFPSGMAYVDPHGTLMQDEEIGYLTEALYQNLGNADTVGDIQWAIWDIFAPGASNSDPYGTISGSDQTNIAYWLGQASSLYATGNYSNLVIYTPVPGTQVPQGDGRPQQYIGINGPEPFTPPVPEPGVLSLVAIGLGSMVAFRRRLAQM